MSKKPSRDFREAFTKMAGEALINRFELAELLATTPAAVSQMDYRGELPERAFPGKRRCCWFVQDVREWLVDTRRGAEETPKLPELVKAIGTPTRAAIGRPRLPA